MRQAHVRVSLPVAALGAGASILDSSCGGIGGCPFAPRATGNIATEDLVYLLDGMGIASGIDGRALAALDPWLAALLGHAVPGSLGKAGVAGRCVIIGDTSGNGPLAYRLRCSNRRPAHDQLLTDLRDGVRVAWLRDTPPSHLWGVHWRRVRVAYPAHTDAYVSTSSTG